MAVERGRQGLTDRCSHHHSGCLALEPLSLCLPACMHAEYRALLCNMDGKFCAAVLTAIHERIVCTCITLQTLSG